MKEGEEVGATTVIWINLYILKIQVNNVNENFKKLVEIHEAQNVEVKNMRKQCDNMRSILMNKVPSAEIVKRVLLLRYNIPHST